MKQSVTDKLNSDKKKQQYNTFQSHQEEREHFIPVEDSDEEVDVDSISEAKVGEKIDKNKIRLEVAEEDVLKVTKEGRLIRFKKMVLKTPKHNEKFDAFALNLGRVGFAARGFVWACVGAVAVSAAFTGEKTQGTSGALTIVAARTGGAVVLIVATLGLLCYASWRIFEGIYGLRINPKSSKFGKAVNGYVTPFASAAAYLIFAGTNVKTIRDGFKDTGNSNSVAERMADNVGGKIVLTIAGVVLIGVGLNWLWDLVKQKYKSEMNQESVEKHTPVKIVVYTAAYLGWLGRAILFNLLGVELIRVCFSDDTQTGGFGAALAQLQRNIAGRIFLIFTGVCLAIFGFFSLTQSKYKQFLMYKPKMVSARTKHSAITNIKDKFNIERDEDDEQMERAKNIKKENENRSNAKEHYRMQSEDDKPTTPLMEKKSKNDVLPPV